MLCYGFDFLKSSTVCSFLLQYFHSPSSLPISTPITQLRLTVHAVPELEGRPPCNDFAYSFARVLLLLLLTLLLFLLVTEDELLKWLLVVVAAQHQPMTIN